MYQIESKDEFFVSKLPVGEQQIYLRLINKCRKYASANLRVDNDSSFVINRGSADVVIERSKQRTVE